MFLRKSTNSRTFVDIIHNRCSKYANWEPSYTIELGDYGTLDKKTGELVREGNVFTDKVTKNASDLIKKLGMEDEKYTITSLDVSEIASNNELKAEIPDLAQAAIKAHFKFSRDYGAVLLLCRPITSKLEGFEKLLSPDNKHLQKKCLVTEIVTCTAYAMYLSSKTSEKISLVLHASSAASTIGGQVGGGWHHEGTSGVFRCGSQHKPDERFTPLYSMVTIGKRKVQRRELEMPLPETIGQDYWKEALPPWGPLDEDGVEEDEDDDSEGEE